MLQNILAKNIRFHAAAKTEIALCQKCLRHTQRLLLDKQYQQTIFCVISQFLQVKLHFYIFTLNTQHENHTYVAP